MNNSQNILLQKMMELEGKIQNAEGQINIARKQKDHYQKQFLDVSREFSNHVLFEKIKSEAS